MDRTWTGLSRRSITTAVGKLKEAGMIAVQHRQRVANLYKIIPSSAGSVGGDAARGVVGTAQILRIKNQAGPAELNEAA
jgi:hypothetical protein